MSVLDLPLRSGKTIRSALLHVVVSSNLVSSALLAFSVVFEFDLPRWLIPF